MRNLPKKNCLLVFLDSKTQLTTEKRVGFLLLRFDSKVSFV